MNSVQLSSIGILLSVKKRASFLLVLGDGEIQEAYGWMWQPIFFWEHNFKSICKIQCTIFQIWTQPQASNAKYHDDSVRIPISNSPAATEQDRWEAGARRSLRETGCSIWNVPPECFRGTESEETAGVRRGAKLFQNSSHCSRFSSGQRAKWGRKLAFCSFPSLTYPKFLVYYILLISP